MLPDPLLHILQAQEAWMARWRGEPVPEAENPSTAELLAAYARSHDALEASVTDWMTSISIVPSTYRYLSGEEHVRHWAC